MKVPATPTTGRDHASVRTDATADQLVADLVDAAEQGDYTALLPTSVVVARDAAAAADAESVAQALAAATSHSTIAALMAIESLAVVAHGDADEVLVDLLSHPVDLVRRHATWRLAARLPTRRAYPALIDQLSLGGIDTLHARRTLSSWSGSDEVVITRLALERLAVEARPAQRARLVELLGAIGDDTDEVIMHLAEDGDEHDGVRTSAIGALAERRDARVDEMLQRLTRADDAIGLQAALAMTARASAESRAVEAAGARGLRVAQLVLAPGLDGGLSAGGRGDTGGVASLLVSLGESLARRDDVDHVLTIGRGSVADALTGPPPSGNDRLSFGTVTFGDDARPAIAPDAAWEHVPAIERGVRRALRLAGPIDVLHLRMADAGTLAGANVAAAAGIRTCFSVAPDPHNVIESLQARGALDDTSFVRLATESHVWFRARMVEQLARDADCLALFPRSRSIGFLDDLDVHRRPAAVVAEGIDIGAIDRADVALSRSATSAGSSTSSDTAGDDGVLAELDRRIPSFRRGLPIVLTVGRLHPVKGMERVVAAWAGDQRLHESCNLVVVGGDLDAPSAIERSVLNDIERLVPSDDPRRAGLVLLGGRPRADVALLQVAAARGHGGGWPGGGVYVDGAIKEEFGLAVLEAMAAGLVVVAPSTGGPPTYIDHGDTGVLVDPDTDLATAILQAFALVDRDGRVARARDTVERRYSIDTMAAQLVDLYRPATAPV